MKRSQSTAKGFAILGSAGMINKILALLYVTILTHIIGNYGNGINGFAYKMYIFVFAITNSGIPVAISKMVAEQMAYDNVKDAKKILKISLYMLFVLGFAATIVTAVSAKFISDASGQPKATLTIIALSPTLLFACIGSAFKGYFQGRSNMVPTAIAQIIEQTMNSILTVVFAALFIKFGVEYAVAGTSLGTSIGALCSTGFLLHVFRKNRAALRAEVAESTYRGRHMSKKYIMKKIIYYAVPIMIGTAAINANDLIDAAITTSRLQAAHFTHKAATELLGILSNQFQKPLTIPLAITAALSTAIIPAISAAAVSATKDVLHKRIEESLKLSLTVTIPSAIGLAVLSKPVITLIFMKYDQGSSIMTMGSWVIILMSIVYIQTSTLQAIGKTYIPPINMVIGLSIKVVASFFLISIPNINIKGAVIGSLICYTIVLILNQIKIHEYLGQRISILKLALKPLFSGIIMGAIVCLIYYALYFSFGLIIGNRILLNDICLIPTVISGVLIYGLSLVLTKAVSAEDISRFPKGDKINKLLAKFHFQLAESDE